MNFISKCLYTLSGTDSFWKASFAVHHFLTPENLVQYVLYIYISFYFSRFLLGSITDIHVFDLQFPLYPSQESHFDTLDHLANQWKYPSCFQNNVNANILAEISAGEPEPGVFSSSEPEPLEKKNIFLQLPGAGAGAAWEKDQKPEPLEKKVRSRSR